MKLKQLFKSVLITLIILGTHYFSKNLNAQTIDSLDIGTQFIPAGYMGCPDNINIDPAWNSPPYSAPSCFKISYMTTCPSRWAGVYWTNTADENGANWGQLPGLNLSNHGYTRITFYAKGEDGGEIVEFGAFGIDNTHRDSQRYLYRDLCPKTTVPNRVIVLTNHWEKYRIDIRCQDLSSVIGGFYWSASWNSQPSGLIFYLDNIQFER